MMRDSHPGSEHAGIGVAPGDVLAGKYRVDRVLGAGGMGVVVAAHHVHLDERVALKFLLPEALRSPDAVARFVREARAAVKIKSEHVARVTDVGHLENGAPYIVMEYLEGVDLSAWLRQNGPMPIPQAADFVLQACEAIADAHVLGIVHRDLKPSNLFCIHRTDGQPSIKVLDFGISKIITPGARADMTATAALIGSPLYMSPEQMTLSKGVDARTDVWSLGIILFELITGRTPFDGEAVTEIAIKVASEPAPPLRAFVPDVPARLEQVITNCLAKDRNARFSTVGELAVALAEFAPKQSLVSVERILGTLRQAGHSVGAPPPSAEPRVATSPTMTVAAPLQTGSSWGQTGTRTRSGGKAIAFGVAAVLASVAVAGTLLLSRARTTTVAPPPAAAIAPPPATVRAEVAPQTSASAPDVPSAEPVAASVGVAAAASNAPTSRAAGKHAPSPPRPPAGPAVAASAPPAAATPKNCDPPFYYDAQGARVFKKECL